MTAGAAGLITDACNKLHQRQHFSPGQQSEAIKCPGWMQPECMCLCSSKSGSILQQKGRSHMTYRQHDDHPGTSGQYFQTGSLPSNMSAQAWPA